MEIRNDKVSLPAPTQVRQDLPQAGKSLPVSEAKPKESEPVVKETPELDLETAVSNIQDYVSNLGRDLQFQVTDDVNRPIITVIDSETQEIIRQIPSEEVVALARHIEELVDSDAKGLFVSSKA